MANEARAMVPGRKYAATVDGLRADAEAAAFMLRTAVSRGCARAVAAGPGATAVLGTLRDYLDDAMAAIRKVAEGVGR